MRALLDSMPHDAVRSIDECFIDSKCGHLFLTLREEGDSRAVIAALERWRGTSPWISVASPSGEVIAQLS
ncbi:MAG: hypothetical protein WAK01_16205 [Methylocystis sp.]